MIELLPQPQHPDDLVSDRGWITPIYDTFWVTVLTMKCSGLPVIGYGIHRFGICLFKGVNS
jgi:hypothetical protein